jgi:hypothetical protein
LSPGFLLCAAVGGVEQHPQEIKGTAARDGVCAIESQIFRSRLEAPSPQAIAQFCAAE